MHGMLELGSTFAGEYRVLRPIGHGGMGAVYEVEQLSTRKRRALKVLSNRFGQDERAQARFIREATVGASIASEHVVDVIGAGVDATTGLPWLAMELLDGMDLKRLLERRGPLGPAHTREVFRQIGHGLAAAHAVGVVHRDLKPENVFVAHAHRAGTSFTIKILDFGIAKVTRESVMTTDTATIGSPMWMAPEQINAEQLSARTDVWALGLLAFWTLTRRVFWRAAYGTRVTVQALFAEQLFAPIDAPTQRARAYGCDVKLPPEFDAWFSNCVARSPDARFADAGAAVTALCSVLEEAARNDPLQDAPLLPAAEDSADLRRSAPVPISSRPFGRSDEMAGTTGDVLGGDETTEGPRDFAGGPMSATSPTSATPGFASTNLHGGPDNHPTQMPPSFVPPPPVRRTTSAPGRVAVAFAIPAAAFIGAGVAYAVLRGDDVRDPPPPLEERRVEPEKPLAEDDRPTPPQPEVPPAQAVDPSALPPAVSLSFLGWTADGEHFAVRAAYGNKLPERDRATNFLELVHVIDGATGEVEASYAVDRVVSGAVASDDPLARAAEVAGSSERWLERRVSLLLQPPEARRAPRRSGELRAELLDVPGRTRVQLSPKRGGFDVSWWGFRDDASATGAPRLQIAWTSDSGRATVLDEAFAIDHRQLAAVRASGEVTLRNEVRVYWSPDETHCVVVFDGHVDPPHPTLFDRRWFLRAVP